jgi:Pup amidohydrolase
MRTNEPFQLRRQLPKLCGADIELGNFIAGGDSSGGTAPLASRLLLEQIRGFPVSRGNAWGVAYETQDWGRKFLLENGGCIYIDLDHLELALPEVLSARDHVAAWHAMLRLARRAQEAVNADLPKGRTIEVLVNNSDGQDNSYGSHLDFLITRRAWDEMFHNRLHTLLFLVSYQVSSIVVTGQGKVGSENGSPAVPFQISQRADFFEVLMSIETTRRRPLANSRNEPLCGGFRHSGNGMIPALEMARLHVIFYDNTLCPVGCLLKVGVMQIVLAMIEAERVNPGLILDDPLEAIRCWSHDPSLKARAALIGGQQLTAVELQLRFLEEAKRFVAEGGCEGFVPQARQILDLWEDTLLKLSAGNLPALTSRIDWVLKAALLERAMRQHPEWGWDSPELKTLDLMYGSLRNGLYWACERSGVIEPVVSEAEIERFTREPPEDTRAWSRAMLLRSAAPEEVLRVDWDEVHFRLNDPNGRESRQTLPMSDPLSFSRAKTAAFFESADCLAELLELLGSQPAAARTWSGGAAITHWGPGT